MTDRRVLTEDQIAKAWFDAEYGPGHTVAPGYAVSFARAIEALAPSNAGEDDLAKRQGDAAACLWAEKLNHYADRREGDVGFVVLTQGECREIAALLAETQPSHEGTSQPNLNESRPLTLEGAAEEMIPKKASIRMLNALIQSECLPEKSLDLLRDLLAPAAVPLDVEPVAWIHANDLQRLLTDDHEPQATVLAYQFVDSKPLYAHPAGPPSTFPDAAYVGQTAPTDSALDAARLLYFRDAMDGIHDIDFHEEAAICASAFGREEANDDDYLAAIRTAIDAAMAQKRSGLAEASRPDEKERSDGPQERG